MTHSNKLIVTGWIVAMFFGLVSCTKEIDSRDFPINPVNDIRILGFSRDGATAIHGGGSPEFSGEIGTVLMLEPHLSFLLGEESSTYLYEWFVINDERLPRPDVRETPADVFRVGTERILSLPLEGFFSNTTRVYQMLFRITDKNTGLAFQHRFRIRVSDRYQRGWMILNERQNDFDITMLAEWEGAIFVRHNLLDVRGSTLPRAGETAKALYVFQNTQAPHPTLFEPPRTEVSLIIRTDKATNSIHSDNFGWRPEWNISAFAQATNAPLLTPGFNPTVLTPLVGTATALRIFMHYNDSWFLYAVGNPPNRFGQPINRVRDINAPLFSEPTFSSPPFIAGTLVSGTVLFDDDNKRFMRNPGTQGLSFTAPSSAFLYSIPLVDGDTPQDEFFSWHNNIASLHYMTRFNQHGIFAIIKDSYLNRYRFIQFRFAAANTVEKSRGATFNDNAFIESITFFAKHPTLPFFYVVTNNNRVWKTTTADGTDINAFVDITDDVLQPGYNVSTFRFVSNWQGHFREFLTIGSYDPNGTPGENGRVEFYNVHTGSGALSIRTHSYIEGVGEDAEMRFTGFGRPIDVGHKAW